MAAPYFELLGFVILLKALSRTIFLRWRGHTSFKTICDILLLVAKHFSVDFCLPLGVSLLILLGQNCSGDGVI